MFIIRNLFRGFCEESPISFIHLRIDLWFHMINDNKNTLFGGDSANEGNATSGVEQLSIFNNSAFGDLRVMMVNGEPLFCLPDLCKMLDLNPSKVSQRLEDGVLSKYAIHDSIGRMQLMNFVNETGLYDTIFESRKEEARSFRRWVTSEVIPSIRKTGKYELNPSADTPSYMIEDPILRAQRWIEEKKREIELEEKAKIMAPKAKYFDALVDRNLLTNFRDTAKELHVGPKFLVNYLLEHGYLYRDAKSRLKPFAPHVDAGLFKLKEYSNDKHSGVQTLVTPRGREAFRLLLSVNK